MSTDVTVTIDAVDNASSTLSTLGNNVKTLVTSFSGVATGALGLYNSFERVADSSVTLDRANVNLEKSTRTYSTAQDNLTTANQNVTDAQKNLNDAIAKYGADSPQATQAANDLKDAQDKQGKATNNLQIATDGLNVSQEKVDEAQRHLNDSYISAAITAIPQVITMISSATTAYGTLKDMLIKTDDASIQLGGDLNNTMAATGGGGSLTGSGLTATSVLSGVGAAAAGVGVGVAGVEALKSAGVQPGMTTGGYAPYGNPTARAGWDDMSTYQKIPGYNGTYVAPPGSPDYAKNAFDLANAEAKAKGMQHGGIVEWPTFALLGEAGPEAVIPLDRGGGFGSTTYNISIPVTVEGSVDQRTLAVLRNELKNVVVEATSQGAPATKKRIKLGSSSF